MTSASHRRWPLILLIVIALLGVAGTAGFGWAWNSAQSADGQTAAVSQVSREFVLALTNFDPGTVGSDFNQLQSLSCCTFAKQAKQYFGSSIRSELSQAGAGSRGKVDALYVQSVQGGNATSFAVVSQTYLNSKSKAPTADTLRLVIGSQEINGIWKISSVQVLQQPVSPGG